MARKMGRGYAVGKTMHLLLVAVTYLFLWIPLVVLITFSFNSKGFPSPWSGFTWNWYIELIDALYLWKAFANSLTIAISATILSVLMSASLIFFAAQGGKVDHYIRLFYGSLIIPETVLGVSLLSFFGLLSIPMGLATLIVSHTVLGLGFVVPIVYARFLQLDHRLTEVSLVLGATPIQTFFKVTLPLLAPSFVTSALLVFVISFDDFVLTYFCAGSSVQTLSLYILSLIRSGISPVVNALSAVLLLMSSILVLLYFRLSSRSKLLA